MLTNWWIMNASWLIINENVKVHLWIFDELCKLYNEFEEMSHNTAFEWKKEWLSVLFCWTIWIRALLLDNCLGHFRQHLLQASVPNSFVMRRPLGAPRGPRTYYSDSDSITLCRLRLFIFYTWEGGWSLTNVGAHALWTCLCPHHPQTQTLASPLRLEAGPGWSVHNGLEKFTLTTRPGLGWVTRAIYCD